MIGKPQAALTELAQLVRERDRAMRQARWMTGIALAATVINLALFVYSLLPR